MAEQNLDDAAVEAAIQATITAFHTAPADRPVQDIFVRAAVSAYLGALPLSPTAVDNKETADIGGKRETTEAVAARHKEIFERWTRRDDVRAALKGKLVAHKTTTNPVVVHENENTDHKHEPPADLTADCARLLPPGTMDDTTYSQIEDILDRCEIDTRRENGEYLKLGERVQILADRTGYRSANAEQALAKEREACAQEAFRVAQHVHATADDIVNAIRARKNTGHIT